MTGMNSARWDKVYKDFKGGRFSVWKEEPTVFFREKIKFLQDRSVKTILDAGCGDGRNLLAFAKAGFQMIGADSSKEACRLADRVKEKYPLTKIIQSYILLLDNNVKFDAIICDYLLVHMEESKKTVQKFFDLLKKDGFLMIEFLSTDDPACKIIGCKNIFTDHGIYHHFFSLNEVKELLSSFKILEIQKFRHQDPDHVDDYPRSGKHMHDSIYVLCQKP